MRIGLVIEHFNPQRGGAEQWTWQFTERLLAGGHDVHVLAGYFAPSTHEMPIVRHHVPGIGSRLGFAAAAEAALRRLSFDVVHDMGSGWHCDLFESHDGSRFAQWEQKLRCMPSWTRPAKRRLMRVLPRYRQFRELLARQFSDRNRLILALSQMVADDYLHYHNVRPGQIRLIHNGVDTERFSPAHRLVYREEFRARLRIHEDETLLLFVGHDFYRKGLATAIRAVGRLIAEGEPVRLAVVGGRRSKRHRLLARRLGAASAVDFIGTIRDPVPYYAAADVYVLPTFYDPCSLGVLEAAASGLPSVTTRFNGAGELLTQGRDGYLTDDPADDDELAHYLRPLMNRSVQQQMGQAARQTALAHTLQQNCERIVEVYREIAGRKRRAA